MAKSKSQSKKSRPGKSATRRKTRSMNFNLPRKEWLPILSVLVLTAIVFAKSVGYEFVNWDDDFNIAKNPNLRALDWTNIKGIFTSHVIGNYNPLSTFTFLLERHLISEDPWIYHLNNILLHLLCVFFSYRIIRILGIGQVAAIFGALLFALHPMRVESVVWITERKDVLFGVFYLAALLQYIRWVKSGFKKKYYWWAIILFLPALLAKIQAVALPLSFLAIDFLLARKIRWKLIIEKIPFFAMSFLTGLLGIYFLGEQGSIGITAQNFDTVERIAIGIYSYFVYILKFIFPYKMSPLYPYPASLPWYVYASSAGLLVMGAIFIRAWIKKQRMLVFGIAFFTFNIVFVLQIVGAGQGFLADRFTYIPYLGLIIMAVYYWEILLEKNAARKNIILGLTAAYMAVLTVICWNQISIWKNSETLWTHVIKYYKNSPLPFRNRATYLREQGEFDKAVQDYDRSLALKQDADVFNSRARLYFDLKEWSKAIEDYNLAITLDPLVAEYWVNRGAAKAMLGNLESSLDDVNEGLRLDPNHLNGLKSRSLIYLRFQDYENAHRDILKYLENNPYDADVWYENGRLYRLKGNNQASIPAFTRAIQLNPNQGLYFYERSKAYLAVGQKAQAQSDLAAAKQRGVKPEPGTEERYR